jgi:NAD(P)-dependent dehydrogenase (short-subunit alcohol dehydrogenase family)
MSPALADWTVADIPDLTGCRAIVTGANSGIGFHTALELARHNARVTLAVRNAVKGEAARQRIVTEIPGASVIVAPLDLADLRSVRDFADNYLAHADTLQLLINNAGIMAVPVRQMTADGFELQIGTMHFGHYALTGLLWPLLVKTAGARVVTVSSIVHKMGKIDFHNIDGEKNYSANPAYCQAKLANLLFGMELHRRCTRARADIRSVIAHPGASATNLQSTGAHTAGTPSFGARVLEKLTPYLMQSAARGAIPSLYAAAASEAESGAYYGPSGFMEISGAHPKRAVIAKQGLDEITAQRLWQISEQRTGVQFL